MIPDRMIRFKFSFSRKVIGLAAWMVAASLGPVGCPAADACARGAFPAGRNGRAEGAAGAGPEGPGRGDVRQCGGATGASKPRSKTIKADRAKLNAALIETAEPCARHRGSHPAGWSSGCRPWRQRGGHSPLPAEPARGHRRGLRRPPAHGPPPAAGGAGPAGGYAGGGPRLDHARRRSAGTAQSRPKFWRRIWPSSCA